VAARIAAVTVCKVADGVTARNKPLALCNGAGSLVDFIVRVVEAHGAQELFHLDFRASQSQSCGGSAIKRAAFAFFEIIIVLKKV
jgi:hypothetical protein